jgi:hypothetical protein
MTQHTIFGSSAPAAVQNSDTAQLNLATAFYITSGSTWTATGIRVYIDPASNAPLTGYHGYLSSGNSAGALTLLGSVAFSVTKTGWNEIALPSPVSLAVGTKYWVTVYFPGGCYSATGHAFDTARQAWDASSLYGAGTSEVLPGNGVFSYAGPGDMGAASTYNANWYGVDVTTDDGLVGGAPPRHTSINASIAPPRWKAAIRSPRWASTILQPRWKAAIMGPTTLPAATGPEYLPLTVTRSGPGSAASISAGCSYSIVAGVATTPGTWTACTVIDGNPCATISGLTPGTYTVFVQILAGPETIVRNLGQITLT